MTGHLRIPPFAFHVEVFRVQNPRKGLIITTLYLALKVQSNSLQYPSWMDDKCKEDLS